MAMNYEHYDIAFLMMAWQILVPLGHAGYDVPPLTDEIRDAYVKFYLRAKYEASNHNPSLAITDKQMKLASIAVRILETAACLRLFATAMMFIDNECDTDFLPMIALAKNIYEDSKSNVKRLRDTYLRLRAEPTVDEYWQMNTYVGNNKNTHVLLGVITFKECVNVIRNILLFYRVYLRKNWQTSNIIHTLVGNTIVDHSDVVGVSPVSAAPTTSSLST